MARIWRRLTKAEREVLMELSVFRAMAPADHWLAAQDVLDALTERKLAEQDGRGGVMCATHIIAFVRKQTAPDLMEMFHLRAASAFEDRGEFVEAMHHYVVGKQPAMAVWLWFTRRVQQVERGNGPRALEVLEQIAASDVPHEQDRAALGLARAELLRLVGHPEKMAQE